MQTLHHNHFPMCIATNLQIDQQVKDYSISGEMFEIAVCQNCGFRLTQDHPDESSIGPYYESEEYISHSDTSRGIINSLYHWVRNIMLNRKYKLIKRFSRGKELLDIGCGTGYFLHHMKSNHYHVKGVEKDEAARNFAIQQFQLNVKSPGDFFQEKPNKQFDIITLWHVLEHLENLDEYMETIQRALKDDGLLVIALPNHTSLDAKKYKHYWAGYDVPRHLWHFHPATLDLLLQNFNLRLKTIKILPFDSYYNSLLSEKYRKTKLALLSGFFAGFISHLNSIFNKEKASSIIYLCEKAT